MERNREIRRGGRMLPLDGRERERGLERLGPRRKRRRSSLSSAGNEHDEVTTDTVGEDVATELPMRGNLHQRRASASPKKFRKSQLDLPPINTEHTDDQPAKKKVRTGNKIEITYDASGTPVISSFSSDYLLQQANSIEPPAADHQDKSVDAILSTLAKVGGPQPPESLSSSLSSSTSSGSTVSSASIRSELLNSLRSSTSRKPFSLINAFCRDNDLLLPLVSYLTIPSIISLYAISKPFHYLLNRHQTAFILSIMRTWAPDADTIYPWRCYRSLCVKDPSKRQKKRLQGKENDVNKRWDDLRDCPGLKWLQMVVWREGVCRDMLIQLAVKGLRCHPGTLDALKRMWFLQDLPLNAHRVALIRTPAYISDANLHNLTQFLLKVDMSFTHPAEAAEPVAHPNQRRFPARHGGGMPSGVALRKMLLELRQLTPLWRVLRGWSWDPEDVRRPMTRLDVLRLWVRCKYIVPEEAEEDVKKMEVMNIPWYEVGNAGYERTGVAFLDLAPSTTTNADSTEEQQQEKQPAKMVPIIHPSIVGASSHPPTHQQAQLLQQGFQSQNRALYPHARRIVLAHEKPREKLLRPDELIVKECVRRRLGMHKKWAIMMLDGFCDDLGRNIARKTEEELMRMEGW